MSPNPPGENRPFPEVVERKQWRLSTIKDPSVFSSPFAKATADKSAHVDGRGKKKRKLVDNTSVTGRKALFDGRTEGR